MNYSTRGKNKPSNSWMNDKNDIKAIKTKSGNEIILDDTSGKETIKILNKGGENSMTLTMGSGGSISISSCNKVSVTGTSITVSASEDMTLNAKELKINVEDNMTTTVGKTNKIGAKNHEVTTEEAITMKASKTVNLDAKEALNGTGGKGVKLVASGNDASLESSTGNVKVAGAVEALVEGSKTAVKGKAETKVEGLKVDVMSTSITAISGAFVKLN